MGVGWQLRAIASNMTHLEQWELAAAQELKAARPDIKVMVTRNTDCAGLNWDLVKQAVKEHPEFWLQTDKGQIFEVRTSMSTRVVLLCRNTKYHTTRSII